MKSHARACAWLAATGIAIAQAGCATPASNSAAPAAVAIAAASAQYYGTLEPFASEAVYFVMTDRFVNGDPANDHRQQGGANRTFDRPLMTKTGVPDNIGYLGGDFRGVLDYADYIREMGFSSVWITPIVDNPDEAFTGSSAVGEGIFADKGKAGYHGYWGVDFYRVDEHLESADLTFADLTRRLRNEHGLKTVLDIVGNHGSPAWSMPVAQPKFGQIYGPNGRLRADHQNLPPARLDPADPLQQWFMRRPELAELADFNHSNRDVVDYLVGAYLQWIDQGADAFRIDTIKWVPHSFWFEFARRVREHRPGFFLFAEAFDYDPKKIAEHTRPENGAISVFDFPGRKAIVETFEKPGSDYAKILDSLHVDDRIYQNPYDLMTFYDNHDMQRMNASDAGFIDAHNWLFTARGIPVVYYGSEMGFMRGAAEHEGNRNYFGVENIEAARKHPIRQALAHVAELRRKSVALQRGLQVDLATSGDKAAFLRVYAMGGVSQTALVMLNKGDAPAVFSLPRMISTGGWADAATGSITERRKGDGPLTATVPAHGVKVLLLNTANDSPGLRMELDRLMAAARLQ
jgi:cyclomaltodextrin glucanotransferase